MRGLSLAAGSSAPSFNLAYKIVHINILKTIETDSELKDKKYKVM